MDERTIVIVGAGLGAARAAVNLRKEGFDGRIVMLGEEAEVPYERPPLSKEYLRGTTSRDEVRVKPAEAWMDDRIEVLTGTRASEIDLRAREVETEDGQRFGFWRLLLATGSSARPLPVPGADLPGVFSLRTFDDADAIRAAALASGEVLVIGGGWVGAEVAASLRQLDVAVTMAIAGRCRSRRSSDPRSVPSTGISMRRTVCTSSRMHAVRPWSKRVRWSAPGWQTARTSPRRSSWPASAPGRATSWPAPPG